MTSGNSNLYILFICISVPILLILPLAGKRVRSILGFLLIGLYVCLFSANISGVIRRITHEDMLYLTTTVTPIVEECLKSLPVLFCVIFVTDDREEISARAAALGLGFTLLENTYILLNFESPSILWALTRGFGSSLMHVICSVAVGNALAGIWKNRKTAVSNTFALLTAAIIYHAIYNALVKSDYPWLGIVLTVITFVLAFFFIGRLYPNLREEIRKKRQNP